MLPTRPMAHLIVRQTGFALTALNTLFDTMGSLGHPGQLPALGRRPFDAGPLQLGGGCGRAQANQVEANRGPADDPLRRLRLVARLGLGRYRPGAGEVTRQRVLQPITRHAGIQRFLRGRANGSAGGCPADTEQGSRAEACGQDRAYAGDKE